MKLANAFGVIRLNFNLTSFVSRTAGGEIDRTLKENPLSPTGDNFRPSCPVIRLKTLVAGSVKDGILNCPSTDALPHLNNEHFRNRNGALRLCKPHAVPPERLSSFFF
jgi:hypothetical protein